MSGAGPLISIIIPLYNSEDFLSETIESLLAQTYPNFELIIVDDGSVDQSLAIARSYDDERINIIEQRTNKGIVETLNRGLDEASGTYVARMDSDDIALPERLASQVAFLEGNRDVVALGSRILRFGDSETSVDIRPLASDMCDAFLLFATPLVHPSVMMRRAVVETLGLRYDPQFSCTEDYEFWVRLSQGGAIANLENQLLKYRIRSGGVTGTKMDEMRAQQQNIHNRMLTCLGIDATKEQLLFHQAISEGRRLLTRKELLLAREWLQLLISKNNTKLVWDQSGLAGAIGFIWGRLCRNCGHFGMYTLKMYTQGFGEISLPRLPFKVKLIFVLSCCYHQLIGKKQEEV